MVRPEERTIDLAFSSEQPYAQRWGVEILDHSPGAMRTTRTGGDGLPILREHQPALGIFGRLKDVKLCDDKKARGTAVFSRRQDAQEVLQDIEDGIITDVSVGYQVHHMQEMDVKKLPPDLVEMAAREKLPVYRITDWEPFECSLVAAPADPTVGVGRSKVTDEGTVKEEEVKPPTITVVPKEEKRTMSENTGKTLAEYEEDLKAEREKASKTAKESAEQRVAGIYQLAKRFRQFVPDFIVEKAVSEGMALDEFQKMVLARVETGKPVDTPIAELGLSNQEIRRYSMSKAILSQCKGSNVDASFEKACSDEIRKRLGEPGRGGILVPQDIVDRTQAHPRDGRRDLSVALTGDSAGGYLRGTDHLGSEFIDLLRNRLVSRAAGARILSGLRGNVSIPTRSAGATSYWVAEGSAPTEGANTFGTVALTPRNVGAYVAYTRQLLLQSNPSIDALVSGDLALSLATAIDLAVFHGTGTLQPLGLDGQGIGTTTATSVNYTKMLDFQTDVAAANALTPGCAYVTTPTVAAILCTQPKFTNGPSPLWEGGILESANVCGFRGFATNQITAGYMFFGDFSQVLIGEWGVLELLVDPYTEGKTGIINVIAFQTVDVAVRYAAAFSYSTSVTAPA